MIEEALKIDGSDEFITFSIGDINRQDVGYYELEVIFKERSRDRKITLTGLSEFDLMKSAIIFIGNTLRGIMKDRNIKFDLDGLTMDEYIPLPKSQRDAWDE